MRKSETFHTPFSPSIMETQVPKRPLEPTPTHPVKIKLINIKISNLFFIF